MNPLSSLKDLEAVIDLCRKKGVSEFSVGGVSFKLGAEPEKKPRKSKSAPQDQNSTDRFENFPDRILTPEELIYYSAGGMPPRDESNGDNA